ncbi:MAG: MotA/TolQ/ExbB proton channel family protein [Oligoflexia bacterium]|nr:MotA/TolQ/ExbB proton channel family protein [Oligoflexia bacterium]
MNLISIGGFILAVAVLFTGLRLTTDNLKIYFDYEALFIVIGGTLASTAISVQLNKVGGLIKVFIKRILIDKKIRYDQVIKEMMRICEAYRNGESLDTQIPKVTDDFLKEALELIRDEIMDIEETFDVLQQRIENMHFNYVEEASKMRSLGKYPPSYGIMGTTIGMIVLLGNLGGSDAIKKVGPAMSIAMIATMYGIVLANMALIPIGENLTNSSKETFLKNQLILEGLRLIVQKSNPIIVAEKLNSFLTPKERLNWKEVVK